MFATAVSADSSVAFHFRVRGDDTQRLARFVWAVVHGVAMLGIDGQLPEAGSVEELMRYALKRLRTGIEAGTD